MDSVFVAGGAGFVGCNLVDGILSNFGDGEVIIYDNLSRKGVKRNLEWLIKKFGKKRLKFVKGDVRNASLLAKSSKNCDVIYHTAAQVAVTTSVSNPIEDFEINALGTINMLEAARKGNDPVFIFTSTNKVYGGLESLEIKESDDRYDFKDVKGVSEKMPIDPCTPYGCSKCAGDTYTLDYADTYGMKNVVFRMSCIYGQRQFGNEDQGWVAHFLISHMLGKPVTIYGDGKQVRDILYVDDLVNAFFLATKNIDRVKGEFFNIGGGSRNTISLLELIEYVEDNYNKKFKLSYSDWRPHDQKIYCSDITLAKSKLGWEPKISRFAGIDRLYSWVVKNKHYFK
jgi:CDP-paratose 2-epimerase